MSFELPSVPGGRRAPCAPAHDRLGHVVPGCQIVAVTAPARAHLSFTVSYAAAPQLKQSFAATADAQGHYHGAFPVLYNPAAQASIVRVYVRVTLPNGSPWGTTELCFIDSPALSRHH